MWRFIVPQELWTQLADTFRSQAPKEVGAFLLFRPGRSHSGIRLIAHDLLLSDDQSWDAQGGDHLRPAAGWVSSALSAAINTSSGLAFVHSHPDGGHPPTLSSVDRRTSAIWGQSFAPITEQAFVSLVWSNIGVTGDIFSGDHPRGQALDTIEVHGSAAVRWLHPVPDVDIEEELDDRQMRALSSLGNRRLRMLHVALVGVGGTGSPLAEALVRMGVSKLTLVDPDRLDTPSNVRRVVGSRIADLRRAQPKVTIVARHLKRLGLTTEVKSVARDAREERVARLLLDADLVVSSTHDHSTRAFLNQLCLQYALPLIDVGTRVGSSMNGAISGMPIEVRVLLQDAPCLWCRHVLDSETIRIENLPPDERAGLEREGYIQGVLGPAPSLAALNGNAAAAAGITAIRLYSGQPVPNLSFIVDPWEQYSQSMSTEWDATCICHQWRLLADQERVPFKPVS